MFFLQNRFFLQNSQIGSQIDNLMDLKAILNIYSLDLAENSINIMILVVTEEVQR